LTNGNKEKKWVSDIVGDDYKKWNKEFVVLDCGTGCGKSYFCINVLGTYAKENNKKILYLCNRRKLRQQIYDSVKKIHLLDTIYVTSYQSLQKKIQKEKQPPRYDYIVADECHYFTTDALFNDYTDVSYNYIMQQKESVVIFVSATAKTFFSSLKREQLVPSENVYQIEKSYSYVDVLYFYKKDELTSIIDDILSQTSYEKIVVFCNAKERMKEMHTYYKDMAEYYCSNNADMELKEICGYDANTKRVKECVVNHTFSKRILFTTKVLDNGIDLKDQNIKHIFSEIFDVDCTIQALGRKRSLHEKDTCTFYIREFPAKAIQGFLNINNSQLKPVDMFNKDYKKFYEEYGNGQQRKKLNNNRIFYSYFSKEKDMSKIKVNKCRYDKYKRDNIVLRQMKEWGYLVVLNHYLGQELSSKSKFIEVDVKCIDKFMEYLSSIEGKMLFHEDKEKIKAEFESVGVKLRYTGINTFNGALEDLYKGIYSCRFYNKTIEGKVFVDTRRKLETGHDNPNHYKKYWILENRKTD